MKTLYFFRHAPRNEWGELTPPGFKEAKELNLQSLGIQKLFYSFTTQAILTALALKCNPINMDVDVSTTPSDEIAPYELYDQMFTSEQKALEATGLEPLMAAQKARGVEKLSEWSSVLLKNLQLLFDQIGENGTAAAIGNVPYLPLLLWSFGFGFELSVYSLDYLKHAKFVRISGVILLVGGDWEGASEREDSFPARGHLDAANRSPIQWEAEVARNRELLSRHLYPRGQCRIKDPR